MKSTLVTSAFNEFYTLQEFVSGSLNILYGRDRGTRECLALARFLPLSGGGKVGIRDRFLFSVFLSLGILLALANCGGPDAPGATPAGLEPPSLAKIAADQSSAELQAKQNRAYVCHHREMGVTTSSKYQNRHCRAIFNMETVYFPVRAPERPQERRRAAPPRALIRGAQRGQAPRQERARPMAAQAREPREARRAAAQRAPIPSWPHQK